MLTALFLTGLLAAADPARVDYFHTGNAGEERFALEGIALEGPWPGPPNRMIDNTDLGNYYFEIVGRQTARVLFSRGFASVYGEWETTAEAKEAYRTFQESLRFPAPSERFRAVVKKRRPGGAFQEVWSVAIDLASPSVDKSVPRGKVWAVLKSGEPSEKVDILLMGDGYTAAEMEKWHRDARRLVDLHFAVSPFKERKSDFNVWAVDTPSDESGVSRPSDGVYRRSALRAAYDSFGTERYVLTFDNKRMREAAAAAPYEFIEIVVNDRKYGGGVFSISMPQWLPTTHTLRTSSFRSSGITLLGWQTNITRPTWLTRGRPLVPNRGNRT